MLDLPVVGGTFHPEQHFLCRFLSADVPPRLIEGLKDEG